MKLVLMRAIASGVIMSRSAMTGPNHSDGPRGTAGELLPEVYDELRKLAKARLGRERHQHQTLQPTALVHEAYLRVSGDRPSQEWDRRGHFFAAAALAMRRILVERARHYQRIKHGAGGCSCLSGKMAPACIAPADLPCRSLQSTELM